MVNHVKTDAQKELARLLREYNKKVKPKKTEKEIRAKKVLKDAERRMKLRGDAFYKKHGID